MTATTPARTPGRAAPTAGHVSGTPGHAAFCPTCGAGLVHSPGFVQEFWSAGETNFLVWCRDCRTTATISYTDRLVTFEPEH